MYRILPLTLMLTGLTLGSLFIVVVAADTLLFHQRLFH